HSDRRTDAVLLEALLATDGSPDLIGKVVRGLLAHRKAGRWQSTQENAFVLLALDRYFRKVEHATPDFKARVWIGDRFAGEHAFAGRTTERAAVAVPLHELGKPGAKSSVTLERDGKGHLSYRLALESVPAAREQPALDRGFSVTRAFESVERPDD